MRSDYGSDKGPLMERILEGCILNVAVLVVILVYVAMLVWAKVRSLIVGH